MESFSSQTSNEPLAIGLVETRKRPSAPAPAVIHGLVREGETMNIVGEPDAGKSWLAIELALAVATGRTWLDTFSIEQGDVLIIDNELHPPTLVDRIQQVATAMGVADEALSSLYVLSLRGNLKNIEELGDCFAQIKPGRFKLIIVDEFSRALPRDFDEHDPGALAGLCRLIDCYAEHLRVGFVMIHHASEPGMLAHLCDTNMVLRPHVGNGFTVLETEVRTWPPVRSMSLERQFPLWRPTPCLDLAEVAAS